MMKNHVTKLFLILISFSFFSCSKQMVQTSSPVNDSEELILCNSPQQGELVHQTKETYSESQVVSPINDKNMTDNSTIKNLTNKSNKVDKRAKKVAKEIKKRKNVNFSKIATNIVYPFKNILEVKRKYLGKKNSPKEVSFLKDPAIATVVLVHVVIFSFMLFLII